MNFRRTYKATVTYLSSTLGTKRGVTKVTFVIKSSAPFASVNDLAFLKALAQLPAESTITGVELDPIELAA